MKSPGPGCCAESRRRSLAPPSRRRCCAAPLAPSAAAPPPPPPRRALTAAPRQVSGGELFERIGEMGHYSETEAARCFVQVPAARFEADPASRRPLDTHC